MAKGNDKKVVRETAKALVTALGNLLESERERKFRSGRTALSRRRWCSTVGLNKSNVAHIETGRILGLNFRIVRPYLAALRKRDDPALRGSLQQFHQGLKELENFLERF
jgi:hypothetical protein